MNRTLTVWESWRALYSTLLGFSLWLPFGKNHLKRNFLYSLLSVSFIFSMGQNAYACDPPPAPSCDNGAFVWQNDINVSGCNISEDVHLYQTSIYTIPTNTYPAEFSGPVTIDISQYISWDGYCGRAYTGNQPHEQWKVVFFKNGSIVWETAYTADLATGYTDTYTTGSFGSHFFPNGVDAIKLVHWNDATYGENDNSSPNSVYPASLCFNYQGGGEITLDCPADIALTAPFGQNSAVATWNTPAASTTCMVGGAPNCSQVGEYISGFIYMGEHNGSKYFCSNGSDFSWNTAKNMSEAAGGHLVTINDAAENEFVRSVIGASDAWIGYTDENSEGNFYWANGETPGYENWKCWSSNDCEPSGGSQNYTRMLKSDGKWTDREASYRAEFVMEIPCPGGSQPGNVTLTQTGGHPSGYPFPIGSHTITYQATDECGNVETCSFDVTVSETPGGSVNVTCPTNMTVDAAAGQNSAVVNWNTPSVTTTCPNGGATVNQSGGSFASGDLIPAGTHIISYQATDQCGNIDNCSFTITVNPGQPADPASVGNFVWSDNNGNGIQDPGEPGIEGVFVMITDCAGNWVNNMTTDQDGFYQFTDLTPGSYKIKFVAPLDYTVAPTDAGTNDALDNDVNQGWTGFTDCFTLTSGEHNTSIDAGFVPNAPSSNLTMTCPVDMSVTAPVGQNSAQVSWDAPAATSTCTVGSVTVTQTSGPTSGSMLAVGSHTISYQATDGCGNYAQCSFTVTVNPSGGSGDPVTVGDFVWSDTNGNGIQDAGEPGIPGVWVMITDCDGNWVNGMNTGADGSYEFTNIAPGSYKIKFALTTGYVGYSPLDAGSDDSVDSDVTGGWTGYTECFDVVGGQDRLDIDAGFVPDAPQGCDNFTSGGTINGTQTICSGDDAALIGNVTLPSGGSGGVEYMWLAQAGTTCPNNANDAVAGANGPSYDPGVLTETTTFRRCARRTGCTDWVGESNCITVTVDQSPNCGTTCDNFTSGGTINGEQTICAGDDAGLIGNVTLPSGGSGGIEYMWLAQAGTTCPNSANDAVDGANGPSYDPGVLTETTTFRRCARRTGCTQWAGESNCITVTVDQDPDCGSSSDPASVGDFVFSDTNGNGIQDAGEPGVSGVWVMITDCDGNWVNGMTTGADGAYGFDNLTPGSYKIKFALAPGYSGYSPMNAGSNDAVDSDVTPGWTGYTECFTLGAGENNTTIDAGFIPEGNTGGCDQPIVASVGNIQCNDNGTPNNASDDTFTFDLTVSSGADWGWTGGGVTTDMDGAHVPYTFGPYAISAGQVSFSIVDVDNALCTYDVVANPPAPCSNGGGGDDPASVGDFVFADLDGDGIQDAGEEGIPGVFVMITDCDGNWVNNMVTGPNGEYQFNDLAPGSYKIKFALPANHTLSPTDAGTNEDLDSDVEQGWTGFTACFDLASGQDRTDIDAGFIPDNPSGGDPGTIGDFVWSDTNGNGIQDAGEQGIGGVFVMLTDCEGNWKGQTNTAADGSYEFTNVNPGSYKIKFVTPQDHTLSPTDAGSNDNLDSDVEQGWTGYTACFDLASGENITNVDAGFVPDTPTGVLAMNCNSDMNVTAPNASGAYVTWSAPATSSTCTVGSVNVTQTAGPTSGSTLAPGTYTVEYTGTDGCDNVGVCSFTITVTYDGPGTCAVRTITDLLQCNGNVYSSFWAEDLIYGMSNISKNYKLVSPGTFTEYEDGTAHMSLVVENNTNSNAKLAIEMTLTGRTDMNNDPHDAYCFTADMSDWYYYTDMSGTISGLGSLAGAEMTGTWSMWIPQIGTGASLHENSYGFTTWIDLTVVSQPTNTNITLDDNGTAHADLNFNLSGDSNACMPAPQVCADRDVYDAYQCNANLNYGFFANDIINGLNGNTGNHYYVVNGSFVENTDGTAHLSMKVKNHQVPSIKFQIELDFSDRNTTTNDPYTTNHCYSPDDSDWYYYHTVSGTITGLYGVSGGLMNVWGFMHPMQVGTGAALFGNIDDLGATTWLDYEVVSQPNNNYTFTEGGVMDVNILLSGAANACNDGDAYVANSSSKLLDLSLEQDSYTAELTWQNNTGHLNEYFLVERSMDGVNYTPIAQVASDEVKDARSYNFTDNLPNEGLNHYRVTAIAYNGNNLLSNKVAAEFGARMGINLYPNPASEHIILDLLPYKGQEATIQIADQFGKVVKTVSIDEVTAAPVRITLDNFINGYYNVLVNTNDGSFETKKLVITKKY